METTNYWNALDRTGLGTARDLEIDPLRIGISHGIGDVGEGLKANVFRGLKTVELGFFGTGKGFRSQPTGSNPESFGRQEREDIRQLAKINEVELSTHAAPDLGPLSGFTGEAYNKQAKENSLQEIRRALSFAADTAQGGAVVVHIGSRNGELPRALFEVDEQFKMYDEEEKRAPIQLINQKTGQLINLPRNFTIHNPVYNRETQEWENKPTTFNELYKEEQENAKNEQRPVNTVDLYKKYVTREQELIKGERDRFTLLTEEGRKQYEKFAAMYGEFTKLEEEGKNIDYARKLIRNDLQEKRILPTQKGAYEDEELKQYYDKPELFLKKNMEESEKSYKAHQEIARSRARELSQMDETISELKPAQEFVLKEVADSLAIAAMDAYVLEKKEKLERPLFISPENWSPESYGSHPREYGKIIETSRDVMTSRLMKQGIEEKEAKKIAVDHIRGTFDVGHMNFWRKYFKASDPNDPAKADKEFRQWVDKEIEELAKNDIIGNVHLSDNFGYHDEHLAPGEGNTPIESFAEKLEKYGYKGKYIGEPGGQKEGFYHTAWTGALNTLQSPVYRVNGNYARWNDLEHSYFGSVPQSPGFLVGDIVPSKDWTLWSETPLE